MTKKAFDKCVLFEMSIPPPADTVKYNVQLSLADAGFLFQSEIIQLSVTHCSQKRDVLCVCALHKAGRDESCL